jgi:CubicO group peptidase (beta-lactamase class C family)
MAVAGVVLLALLSLAGSRSGWWLSHTASGANANADAVAGGDGGGLPRATPLDERMDAAALERALQDSATAGLQALVVMRDGYVVFERYGRGFAGDTVVDGGSFARGVLGLVAGIAVENATLSPDALQGFDPDALRAAIEAGAHQSYSAYLSHKLWSRLNAGAASFEYSAAVRGPADCCLHARVLDWMRLASLLTDNGRFEGKQLVSNGWLQRMQRPLAPDSVRGFGIELAAAAHGAEPFAMPGVFFLRGPEHWRLWLVPPLKLAILFGASGSDSTPLWDETRLPNLVVRAVSDRPPQAGDLSELQRLVPGH